MIGDPGWSAEQRFKRVFERLALPVFGRRGAIAARHCSGAWGSTSCAPTPSAVGRPRA